MTYDGIGHLDLQPISATTVFYTVKKHETNDCPDDIISIRNQFINLQRNLFISPIVICIFNYTELILQSNSSS